MKKRFYSLLFSLLLCGNLVSSASVSITGKSRMQTGDTTEYSVNPETDITSYVWKAPKGCHIIDGQGSPTIKLASTFLSQDSPLTLIREKTTTRPILQASIFLSSTALPVSPIIPSRPETVYLSTAPTIKMRIFTMNLCRTETVNINR